MNKKDFFLLSTGVILGVLGGLVANMLDRYFSHFGLLFEIPVALLFFGFLFYFEKRWDNMK